MKFENNKIKGLYILFGRHMMNFLIGTITSNKPTSGLIFFRGIFDCMTKKSHTNGKLLNNLIGWKRDSDIARPKNSSKR